MHTLATVGLWVFLPLAGGRGDAELLDILHAAPEAVSESTRREAFAELAANGSPAGVKEIAAALQDEKRASMAAGVLGKLPADRLKEVLPGCLESRVETARNTCVRLAGEQGDATLAPQLHKLLGASQDGERQDRLVGALFRLASSSRKSGVVDVAALAAKPALLQAVRDNLYQLRDGSMAPLVWPLLKHQDAALRVKACRVLARMEDPGSVEVLLKTFQQDKETSVRACCVDALQRTTPAAKANAVAKSLAVAWNDPEVGGAVMRTLVAMKQADAADVMVPGLASPDWRVRAKVARALGDVGHVKSGDALAKLVEKDPENSVRVAALKALAQVAQEETQVAVVVAALEDPKLKSSARDALREFRRPAASPFLFPLMKHPDLQVRRVVARTLGELGETRSAVPLMDAVERDPEDLVQRDAAAALPLVADVDHLPRLLKMLGKENSGQNAGALEQAVVVVDRAQGFQVTLPLVRKHDGLGRRLALRMASDPHPSDEPVFQALALDSDINWRREALYGLSQQRSSSARTTLCKVALEEKDPGMRSNAVQGLAGFRDEVALECVLKTWTAVERGPYPSLKEDLHRALREMTGQDLPEELAAWKTWHAGGMGLGAGHEKLVGALANFQPEMRILAARQLARGPMREDPTPVVNAALAQVAVEKDRAARVALVELLGVCGQVRAVDALLALQEDKPSMPERVALAKSLDALGDGRGTLSLVEDLDSTSNDTRLEAVRALSEVTGEPYRPNPAWWKEWWKVNGERYRRQKK